MKKPKLSIRLFFFFFFEKKISPQSPDYTRSIDTICFRILVNPSRTPYIKYILLE